MAPLRNTSILAGALLVSACHPQDSDQMAANGAVAADEAIEDADARAGRLADQSQILNGEAAHVRGARRQALENEAREDMSEAISVEQEGATDAANVARSTEEKN